MYTVYHGAPDDQPCQLFDLIVSIFLIMFKLVINQFQTKPNSFKSLNVKSDMNYIYLQNIMEWD